MSALVDSPSKTARRVKRHSGLASACDGTVAVEFAIVATSLLLLFLGITEFGWFLWYQSTLQQAVEATARYCSINSSCNVQTVGTSQMLGVDFSPTFTLTSPSCGTQVTASYTFTFVTSWMLPLSMTASSQSCYPTTP